MTLQNELQKSIQSPDLAKRIFRGAIINLIPMLSWVAFLTIAGDNFTLQLKMLVPIATITFGGAAGGAIWHLLQPLREQGGAIKIVAIILGVIVHIVGGWMSLVFGCALVGYWD